MDERQQQALRDLKDVDLDEALGDVDDESRVAELVEYLRDDVGLPERLADAAAQCKLRDQYGEERSVEMWATFTNRRSMKRRRGRVRPSSGVGGRPAGFRSYRASLEQLSRLDPALPEDLRPPKPRGGRGQNIKDSMVELQPKIDAHRRRAQRRAQRRSSPEG